MRESRAWNTDKNGSSDEDDSEVDVPSQNTERLNRGVPTHWAVSAVPWGRLGELI